MRNSIGIGLLGSGGRIRGLANRVTEKEPSTQVVAISDPLESSLNAGLEELNPNAKIYRDHRELVQDSDVDWVMVGSWNSMHRESVVAAFEAGKHVFCEKPLATTLDDYVYPPLCQPSCPPVSPRRYRVCQRGLGRFCQA